MLGLRSPGDASSWLLAVAGLAVIVGVTLSVHVPLNAQFMAAQPLAATQAAPLLRRWLVWHHTRTALALIALCLLLWPMLARTVASA